MVRSLEIDIRTTWSADDTPVDSPEARRTVHLVSKTTLRVLLGVLATCAITAGAIAEVFSRAPSGPVLSGVELQVSAGSYHTCVAIEAAEILCWGLNNSGQLGGGAKSPLGERKFVAGADEVEYVEVGGEHSCYIRMDRRLFCWGYNGSGQIGDGTVKQRWAPVRVTGLRDAVMDVSVGRYHTCSLGESSLVYCWGRNSHGQVGDGTQENVVAPKMVGGLGGARDIAAGERHSCALLLDGSIACWGDNSSGQLGDGTLHSRNTPITVKGVSDAIAVVAGDRHTCALTATRIVLCWGRNSFQELGAGSGGDRNYPSEVPGLGAPTALTAGEHHTCALLPTGRARCWGRHSSGQLGSGNIDKSLGDVGSSPVEVALDGLVSIDAGGVHTCAVTRTGALYCWGYNASTQIGDLGTATRPHPVRVDLQATSS